MLTTIRIDKIEMGHIAMDLLIKKIQGEPVKSVIIKPDTLIVRNSTRVSGSSNPEL
jgi:DNA-binding LacI/PurR family transcriptional regulator